MEPMDTSDLPIQRRKPKPACLKLRLSKRQLSILLFVATYQQVYGRSPTVGEIATKHGMGVSAAEYAVESLIGLGYLTKRANTWRGLRLTDKAAP